MGDGPKQDMICAWIIVTGVIIFMIAIVAGCWQTVAR